MGLQVLSLDLGIGRGGSVRGGTPRLCCIGKYGFIALRNCARSRTKSEPPDIMGGVVGASYVAERLVELVKESQSGGG